MFREKKGFTLVEMIVTITILGIVTLIALPSVTKIQEGLTDNKYEVYRQAVETAAKLYLDTYEVDIFGNQSDGCTDISLEDILKNSPIEDVNIEGVTCNNPSTVVRVTKRGDTYDYEVYINCTSGSTVVYKDTYDASKCNGSIDDTGPSISMSPNSSSVTKGTTVSVKLSDSFGFSPNQSIQYEWLDSGGRVVKSGSYDWKNKLLTTNNLPVYKINTPSGVTGTYKLKIIPTNVSDSLGNITEDSVLSGNFILDNTPPVISVKAYKRSGNSNGAEVGNVSTNAANPNKSLTITKDNKNGWLSKSSYPDGIGLTINYSDSNGVTSLQYGENSANLKSNNSNAKKVSLSSSNPNSNSGTLNKSITQDGYRYIEIKASDRAGNASSVKIDFSMDRGGPSTPSSGSIGRIADHNAGTAGGSTDGLSGIKEYLYCLKTNGSTPANTDSCFGTNRSYSRACGRTTWAFAIAVDNAGNRSGVRNMGSAGDAADSWSGWSGCSRTCGGGTQTRSNSCALIGSQSQACNTQECYPASTCNIRGSRLVNATFTCSRGHHHTNGYIHYCTDSNGHLYVHSQRTKSLSNLSPTIDTGKNGYEFICPKMPYGPKQGWTLIDD